MKTFQQVLEELDRFTAPPPKGVEHEQHVINAMRETYLLMAGEVKAASHSIDSCPHCGTTEMLCGFNGSGCDKDNSDDCVICDYCGEDIAGFKASDYDNQDNAFCSEFCSNEFYDD